VNSERGLSEKKLSETPISLINMLLESGKDIVDSKEKQRARGLPYSSQDLF